MKPRYVHIEYGWDKIASFIDDKKELALWLKDGSLAEDDVVFEVKKKFKVVKIRGELLISEVKK